MSWQMFWQIFFLMAVLFVGVDMWITSWRKGDKGGEDK